MYWCCWTHKSPLFFVFSLASVWSHCFLVKILICRRFLSHCVANALDLWPKSGVTSSRGRAHRRWRWSRHDSLPYGGFSYFVSPAVSTLTVVLKHNTRVVYSSALCRRFYRCVIFITSTQGISGCVGPQRNRPLDPPLPSVRSHERSLSNETVKLLRCDVIGLQMQPLKDTAPKLGHRFFVLRGAFSCCLNIQL